jgi:hypothetical protein
MNDYFFKLVDTRCQLAGLCNLIETYLKAVEEDKKLIAEVSREMLDESLVEARQLLDKGIHDEECQTERQSS